MQDRLLALEEDIAKGGLLSLVEFQVPGQEFDSLVKTLAFVMGSNPVDRLGGIGLLRRNCRARQKHRQEKSQPQRHTAATGQSAACAVRC